MYKRAFVRLAYQCRRGHALLGSLQGPLNVGYHKPSFGLTSQKAASLFSAFELCQRRHASSSSNGSKQSGLEGLVQEVRTFAGRLAQDPHDSEAAALLASLVEDVPKEAHLFDALHTLEVVRSFSKLEQYHFDKELWHALSQAGARNAHTLGLHLAPFVNDIAKVPSAAEEIALWENISVYLCFLYRSTTPTLAPGAPAATSLH